MSSMLPSRQAAKPGAARVAFWVVGQKILAGLFPNQGILPTFQNIIGTHPLAPLGKRCTLHSVSAHF